MNQQRHSTKVTEFLMSSHGTDRGITDNSLMHGPDAPQEPPEIRRKKLQISRKMLKEDSVRMKDVEI